MSDTKSKIGEIQEYCRVLLYLELTDPGLVEPEVVLLYKFCKETVAKIKEAQQQDLSFDFSKLSQVSIDDSGNFIESSEDKSELGGGNT